MKLSRIAPILTFVLAACDGEGPTRCTADAFGAPADTAMGAMVNERPFYLGSADGELRFDLDTTTRLLNLIASSNRRGDIQILQIFIYKFTGAGTYPLNYAGDSGTGGAIYGCAEESFWAYGTDLTGRQEGDTLFVTSFDSVTGAIEGTFSFTGWGPDYTYVWVTDGVVRGVVTTSGGAFP